VKVIVLRGAGKTFCVGGDLKAFAAHPDLPAHLREVTTHLHAAIIALARMDAPIVVGVQGSAAGAGLGLAVGGDIVIAAESARFVVAYTKIGLNPDGGTSFLLPRLVGLRRAQELTLMNTPTDARTALEIGLVTRVVPDDALDSDVAAVAQALAAGARRAQGEAKRLLRTSLDESLALHLEAEAAAIVRSAERGDAKEGIAAFLEKRAPTYE
jgi:2-(1,2-epoxy-1,2-dihydrophenyl)acetyl-CoA isomerase